MKIKSYYAVSVEAAIASARKELGSEAMLMNSRKTMPEARHLGEYEVVFACTDQPEPGASAAERETLASELAAIRSQVEEISSSIRRASTIAASNFTAGPNLATVFSLLIAGEVDASLAQRIVSGLRSRLVPDGQ